MLNYSLKRLASSLLTLCIIITVVFVLLRQMPIEGYFDNFEKADAATIQAKLNQLGLNDPIHVQLINFFKDLFHGDLGESSRYSVGAPIAGIIAKKAPLSILLGVMSMALSLLVGIPLGTAMARSKGKFWDKIGTVYIVFINAVPAAVYYIFILMYGTMALTPEVLYGLACVLVSIALYIGFHFLLKHYSGNQQLHLVISALRIFCTTVCACIVYYLFHGKYGTSNILVPMLILGVFFIAMLVLTIAMHKNEKIAGMFAPASTFGKAYNIVVCAAPALLCLIMLVINGQSGTQIDMFFDEKNYATWILPVVSMSLGSTASYAMWLRRYMVDEMNKDYVRLARAKGVSEKKIMMKHVFRNAFVPMIQYIPTSLLYTISGSIYIESLYSIPGMGGLLVTVIERQDNPMVQAIVMIYSCIGIVGLLLGDLLMGLIDPRISFTKKEGAR